MCTVAEQERRALDPHEHDDTELLVCEECDCLMNEDDFCTHCADKEESLKCYCGKEALHHPDTSVIYGGRVYGNKGVWYCPDYNNGCDGWVGTHPNGEPLGRLKNKASRELAKQCHALFDSMWRSKNQRNKMYQWLAKEMGLTADECHFAVMTDDQLKQAIIILKGVTNASD